MSDTVINIKTVKRCAICKYWYDPANSAIMPQAPTIGLWKILDRNQKAVCQKRNMEMIAGAFCPHFECKL